jgi:hypothetical protein
MKQRKHRVVVEITFSEPCTEKRAARFVYGTVSTTMNDRLDEVSRVECKQFSRVAAAAKAQAKPSTRRALDRIKKIREQLTALTHEPLFGA